MNKLLCAVMVAVFALSGVTASAAGTETFTYNFSPATSDLSDLPHESYFKWGIQWNLPTGQVITGAKLTFKNIYDWTRETNDHLYTHLLDTVTDPNGTGTSPNYTQKTGYKTITITSPDYEGGGDNFAGKGLLIGNWSDPYGGSARNFDLVLDIPSSHFEWMSDGNFGFGIDPDCHYYNCGVNLMITTAKAVVPEPMSMMLGVLGLGSIAGLRRFRSR